MKVLQDCDDPMALHDSMKTRHLVMKTNMHANDFVGISIFLNSCPELESLTFDLVTSSRFVVSYYFFLIFNVDEVNRHYYNIHLSRF